jgi:type IV pilus assembly protein PilV
MDLRSLQRGIALVEALIAALVLSIGLLGIAGLQLYSLQTHQRAYQRTQATLLTSELLERMRANRLAAERGDYDRTFGAPRPDPIAQRLRAGRRDLAEWLRRVELTLPPGVDRARRADAQIERHAAEVVVRLRWDDSKGKGRLAEFSARSQL